MSWTSAAAISRSEFSRGWSWHVSSTSVPTATVCSIRPPRYAWWPPRVQGARRNSAACGPVSTSRGDELAKTGVVNLAHEMLEEPLQLVDRAIGGGKELGGIERSGLEPANVVELRDELVAEALDAARTRPRRRRPRSAGRSGRPRERPERAASRCGRAARAPGTRMPLRAVRRSLRAQAKSLEPLALADRRCARRRARRRSAAADAGFAPPMRSARTGAHAWARG